MAQLSGRRIVEMVKEDLKLSKILTRKAFENSIVVNAAVGGSTNFLIHLQAIAGRIGVELNLEDFDKIGSMIPLLVNLKPSGKFLMEDFYYAGGLPVVNIHGKTGFLSPVGDVNSMAQHAIQLLEDENLLAAMRKGALEQAQRFHIDNIIPQYEALYEEVMNKALESVDK